MLVFKQGVYRREALTPQQKEQKKDYLLEEAVRNQREDLPTWEEAKEDAREYLVETAEEYLESGMYDDRLESLINDELPSDWEIEDQATETVYKSHPDLDDTSDEFDTLVEKEREALNTKVENEERPKAEKKVRAELTDWIVDRRYEEDFDNAVYRLYEVDGKDCWRAIQIPEEVDPTNLTGLGIYWTLRQDTAEPMLPKATGKGKHIIAVFHGVVDVQYVDKYETLWANVFGLAHHNETDENEVRFFKHAPVYVKSISVGEHAWGVYRGDGETFSIEDYRRC